MLNTPIINFEENDDYTGTRCVGDPTANRCLKLMRTKIELIEKNFREMMHVLGLDLSDDSLKDIPKRVAKTYVKEFFSGSTPKYTINNFV